MEARFGHNFAHVRVHSGREATESAGKMRSRAYTIGGHIVFGDGEYAPASNAGRWLLAHELAHVVQQDGGRSSGVVQRREVDDRFCAGLTDSETDVDSEVNSEIAAARAAAGSPISVPPFLTDVFNRLGQGIISPIERFIEGLPGTKKSVPPSSLAGTKYSGAETVNLAYRLQTLGRADVVGPAAKVHGICVGADKLGHFFDLGFRYWQAEAALRSSPSPFTLAVAKSTGRATEIQQYGLGATGVFSNADLEANLAGWQFYKDLEASPSGFTFGIRNYITDKWNEQVNPSFYEASVGAVVWSNLLTGRWRGTITHDGSSTPAAIEVVLTAPTGGGLTGTYEWPVGGATPNKGQITGGTITQKTTTVSGQIPGDPMVSATAVTGISIEFDWQRGTAFGKGIWNSKDEQTLSGTWGPSSSRTGGGTLELKKVP
jgi:hypothetical protein